MNYFPDDKSASQFEDMKREAGDQVNSNLIGVAGDISKPETGKEFVRQVVSGFGKGRLDVFVSNAGVCEFADFLR